MLQRWKYGDEPFFTALRQIILDTAATAPSYPSHNRGGWRSDEALLEWTAPEIATLRAMMVQAVQRVQLKPRAFTLRAWAVVNHQGCFHKRHAHRGEWSGILYLDGGEHSARTIFETEIGEVYVSPEPGLLVMFPARTFHSVEKHQSTEPRITVAFDAR